VNTTAPASHDTQLGHPNKLPGRVRTLLTSIVAAACLVAAAACGSDPRDGIDPEQPQTARGIANSFAVKKVATGLNRPTYVGVAPGDDALWILEQPGRVVRLSGQRREVVIDLSDQVKLGAEQGLLGIAFHPDFARNRRLYLHYSDRKGDTRVFEYTLRDGAEPRRGRQLLYVDQPEENHNGGQLSFGPDGRLYLGLGDGGGAFDPDRNAQDVKTKLGKILAMDVDAGGAPRWQVVFYGLRNPWRFWIDTGLNEIWIADVGQDRVEEIDRAQLEFDEPPKNFGWSGFEGSRRTERKRSIEGPGELVWPVAAYEHDDGAHCSVTGGLVYRGDDAPALSGRYVYGDFCSGAMWSLEPNPDGSVTDVRRERAKVPQITHIGADAQGELLIASAAGDVFRVEPSR
jgi:glucose/arabinose dehydrogenase